MLNKSGTAFVRGNDLFAYSRGNIANLYIEYFQCTVTDSGFEWEMCCGVFSQCGIRKTNSEQTPDV